MHQAKYQWVLLLFIAVVPLLLILTGNEFGLGVATRILTYSILVVSLDLLVGYCGLVSLGHCAYFGIGAFSAIMLINSSVANNIIVVLLISIALSLLVGLVFIALAIRTSHFNFLMVTLAFCQMLYFTSISLRSLGGEDGLKLKGHAHLAGMPLDTVLPIYCIAAACLMGYVYIALRIASSNFGLAIDALAHNSRKAGSLGYSSGYYVPLMFLISAGGASVAGVLHGIQVRYVSPDTFAWTHSAEILIMLVLGGRGKVFGGILGATTIILLEESLVTATENWQLYLGIILFATVMFSREGLVGLLARVKSQSHA